MGITRRSFANIAAGLYLTGGTLLYWDWLTGSPPGGSVAALSLHVWPATLVLSLFGTGPAELEPIASHRFGSTAALTLAYAIKLIACTWLIRALAAGVPVASLKPQVRH